jgi:eukaryotic-like serine/threonine-protein kinase
MSATPTFSPGDTFERYTIEARLGVGGMGEVYRAHDERLHRHVALKVVSEARIAEGGAEARARLLREARAAAGIDHPNAVAIYDVGEAPAQEGHEPRAYIVMELVPGETLRTHVGDGAAAWRQRLGWMLDVARALAAAHDRGVVHRDIKPENVMVRRDGLVKVLDFGIARRATAPVDPSAPTAASSLPTLTEQGIQVGTPMYMAPEQIRGNAVDGRTDQFAWGVTAYEVLGGRVPWRVQAGSLGAVASILTDTPPDLGVAVPGLPAGVVAAIERSLSKSPDARFASMRELAAAIEAELEGGPRGSSAPSAARATPASAAPARVASSGASGVRTGAAASAGGTAGADAAATTDLRRYSKDEMRDILQRALERESERAHGQQQTGFSRRELVEAAREAGLDQQAIDAALAEAELRQPKPVSPADRLRRKRNSFYRHAISYIVVNCMLALMNGSFLIPVLAGWGIGVLLHLANVLIPKDAAEEEEEERKEREKKNKKKKRSRKAEEELEAGVSALVQATTARFARQRIATAASSGTPPARDPSEDIADSIQAEVEAAAAAEAEAPHRRQEKKRP